MKKMILPTICFLMIAGPASAQVRRSRHRSPATSSTVSSSAATTPSSAAVAGLSETDNTREVSRPSITVEPDNRKEYMQDGQLATYTGHQAAPINSDEFQSPRKDRQTKKEEQ